MEFTIIPRHVWGARQPNRPGAPWSGLAEQVQVHHTVTRAGGLDVVRAVQADHLGRGWVDIAYNFAVTVDGRIYEGRPLDIRHGNSRPATDRSIVCVGDFHAHRPPMPMLTSVAWLLGHGMLSGWWKPTVVGHRDVTPTACPGQHLYARLPLLRSLAAGIVAGATNPQPEPLAEEDEMYIARSTDPRGRQRNALVSGVFKTELVSNAAMVEASRLGAVVRKVSWEFFSQQLIDARKAA